MSKLKEVLQSVDIRIIATGLSCVFTLLIIAVTPIPNDDAFSYLRAAEVFGERGLEATLTTYGWFGYSVLIAITENILPTDLLGSAYLINILSFALLTWSFITLVMEYRQSSVAAYAAAAIILFFPTISEMRYYLIRDFGYWAFCLTALVQLIRFNSSQRLLHAIGWLLAMIAAVFFRLEGLIILALSPFAMLMPGPSAPAQKKRLFFTLLGLMLAGAIVILLLFMLAGINLVEIFNFTYRWYLPLLADYPDTLSAAAESLQLSARVSEELQAFSGKGMVILVIGYFYTVLANLILTLGPPASAFLLYGFVSRRQALPAECKWPWLFFLVSALLALCTFVSIMQFLTTRYAVMAALLLLSLMPLAIDNLYLRSREYEKEKLFRTVCAACLVFFAVDGLVSFGYSKGYIEEAATWTRENIETGEQLHTNSFAVAYYSGHVAEYDKVRTSPFDTLETVSTTGNVGYLALALSHNETAIQEQLGQARELTELIRFANAREDAVIIYRVNPGP